MNCNSLVDEKAFSNGNLSFWEDFVNEITNIFSLNVNESEKLRNSVTAKIIATIPFAAECKEPERTAIAHLCLYMVELRGFKKYCSHQPSDDNDIYNRLAFISTFESGKEEIIRHGLDMLALIMIEGYKRSKKTDIVNNVYNPLNSGAWDYNKLKTNILNRLKKISVPMLDELFYGDYNEPAW